MCESNELKARACRAVERWAEELWAASLAIHACPELGYDEDHAADVLGGLLTAAGLRVERGIADMPTAFRCEIRGASGALRPAIAFLGEMDALPGIGHACGHNLIGAAAVGAGLGVAAVADAFPGAAVVLGCPAEESTVDGAGGKIWLVRAGAFRDIDAALMMHGGGRDVMPLISSLAVVGYEFAFRGKAAHAASAPEQGINALDGVLHTFAAVNALRQHVRPDVRIHGIITEGGVAPNIVPERAVCRFRVRAADRRYLAEVAEKVVNCARAGALASGAELTAREDAPMYEETRPNAVIGHAFARNLQALGRTVEIATGQAGSWSTDFGNVSQVVPGMAVTIAMTDESVPVHSAAFAAAAASPRGREALLDSAKAMAMTAIDLMAEPSLLEAAALEFEQRGRAAVV